MDDWKASSVVIWGTAVPQVDPPWLWLQMTWNLLQYWDEIGCGALRLYFLWLYLHGAHTSGQHGWLVPMVGDSNWANQQAAIRFTDFFGTSWIKFDVPWLLPKNFPGLGSSIVIFLRNYLHDLLDANSSWGLGFGCQTVVTYATCCFVQPPCNSIYTICKSSNVSKVKNLRS